MSAAVDVRSSVVFLALLSTACATTPTVTPARRAEIHAAANACLPQHPMVARYEVDAFGKITAWYEDEHTGPTAPPLPFFQCVRARMGRSAPAVAAPTAPVTGTGTAPATLPARTPVSPASSGRWPTTLPLPDDTAIRPPAPYVVPALHPFSGRRAGTADHGRAAAGLVVEELRPPSATVVVSFFSDGLGQTRRREAEVQLDTLTLVVEGIVAGSAVRYRLQPDGTLLMRLEDGTGQLVTMTLRRVP